MHVCILMVLQLADKYHFLFYRLSNSSITIHFFLIITLKENIQERELTIFKYTCDSSMSTTSLSLAKKDMYTLSIFKLVILHNPCLSKGGRRQS